LHVAGTLDPVIHGMHPWEQVSLSDDSREVLDLTEAKFAEAGDPSSTPSSPTVSDKLSDADRDTLVLLAKKEGAKDALIDAGISDEEVKQVVEGLIASANDDTSDDKDKQPVAALSEEQRKSIELAESHAKEARDEAARIRTELADERFNAKRTELIAAGVPPADIDLAEPVLKGGAGVIELSNGTKVDAHDVITKLLENREGTIDFSTVGVGAGESEDSRDPAVNKWVKGDEKDED
jgi:hypothetical protein